MIKISDSVPPPKENENPKTRKGRKGDGRQDAILSLKVGQSFFLKASIKSAGVLRWAARLKHPDRNFVAKTENGGCRIWRTE